MDHARRMKDRRERLQCGSAGTKVLAVVAVEEQMEDGELVQSSELVMLQLRQNDPRSDVFT